MSQPAAAIRRGIVVLVLALASAHASPPGRSTAQSAIAWVMEAPILGAAA